MPLSDRLALALDARTPLVDAKHHTAFRAFNGFLEGAPTLALDVYGTTLVVHDHAEGELGDEPTVRAAIAQVRAKWPWLTTTLWKVRGSKNPADRNGVVLDGDEDKLCRKVQEDGVWYALDLRMNRDTSLYLDTRGLRAWAKKSLEGKRVLNTFAYTGSLGVAARAGGASEVMHTDLNRAFLNVAKDSYSMNGWPIRKADFRAGDFFDVLGELKRSKRLFDCVFVDPPLFSVTQKGRVDLVEDVERLLNKVRPLIAHEGYLVAVNNAVFVSGADFHKSLEAICGDGYLSVERRIDAPWDFTGTDATRAGEGMSAAAPFNHSTKIAVLKVTRKDGIR